MPMYTLPSVYVILLWEALINFDEEHQLIHKSRWGHVKICYLACRYYPILITPLYLWACLSFLDQRTCQNIVLPLQLFLLPLALVPQFVILIRAYGFTGRNIYVLLLLSTCFASFIFLQLWPFAIQSSAIAMKLFAVLGPCNCSPPPHPLSTIPSPQSQPDLHLPHRHVGYVMVASVATDAIALIVVFIHCLRIRTTQGPLGRLFIQQGITGFLVMLALNIVSAVTFLSPDHSLTFGVVYPLMFPNIIACRFILQLRRQVSPTETFQLRRQSQLVRDAVGQPPCDNTNTLQSNADADIHLPTPPSLNLWPPPLPPDHHLGHDQRAEFAHSRCQGIDGTGEDETDFRCSMRLTPIPQAHPHSHSHILPQHRVHFHCHHHHHHHSHPHSLPPYPNSYHQYPYQYTFQHQHHLHQP